MNPGKINQCMLQLLLVLSYSATALAEERPNILLLMADDIPAAKKPSPNRKSETVASK